MTTSRLAAIALATTLIGASAVYAQNAPVGPPVQQQGWDPDQMHMRMHERMEARHDDRLKALHDVLAIRPDQESAFQAFAAAVRPPERPAGDAPHVMGQGREGMVSLTTPERLDRMAQRMQEHVARRQEAFARRAAATKALYATLSPEQRRTMDALPLLKGGHDGHRGGWGKNHGEGRRGMDGPGQG